MQFGFFTFCTILAGCRDSNPRCCDRNQVCYQCATHILNFLFYLPLPSFRAQVKMRLKIISKQEREKNSRK